MKCFYCYFTSYQDNITPLYVASEEGHHDVVKTLLGDSADVNITRSDVSYVIFMHVFLLYGKVYEKRDLACIIKKYNKNALRLICYNFRTVNAINFLFSTLHTAPFLYGIIHFEVLNMLRVSIATFDTPLGSNPP